MVTGNSLQGVYMEKDIDWELYVWCSFNRFKILDKTCGMQLSKHLISSKFESQAE